MKDMKDLRPDLDGKAAKIVAAMERRIPQQVGEMLVDGFRESFDLQQFNDAGASEWKQVERRKPGSRWYGFNYKSNSRVPTAARGYTAKGNPRRYGTRGGKTNYTGTATTRAILHGWGSSNLRDSIFLHTANRGRVIVASDQPHAKVHNEGESAKIFGRKSFKMPKRQFMGTSSRLNRRAKKIIDRIINQIL